MRRYMIYACEKCKYTTKDFDEMREHEAQHLGLTVKEWEVYMQKKSTVEYLSSILSETNNQQTRDSFDKAVEELIAWEKEHGVVNDDSIKKENVNNSKFKVGDIVYDPEDCWEGEIIELNEDTARVQFKPQKYPNSMIVSLDKLDCAKWCIITADFRGDDVMYLGWQESEYDDGYFWTSEETISKIIETNNTPEHPFIFRSKKEATKHIKSLNIPQTWWVVRWYQN